MAETYRGAWVIDVLPRLPNAGFRGQHWSKEAKYRKIWHQLVFVTVRADRPPVPLEHAVVTLVRHSRAAPDPDATTGWKPILDGMVRAGILVDDGPEHIELISRWERTPRGGFITIEVEGKIPTESLGARRSDDREAVAAEQRKVIRKLSARWRRVRGAVLR